MENASKALLIAAGLFLAILIISLLVVLYNDISAYYTTQHELTVLEQVTEFNSIFENYHRDNIRGSDLISFMNRIIDYNATQAYDESKNYERIKVTITLGGKEIRKQFKYESEDNVTSQNKYLDNDIITNTGSIGNNWKNDRELIAITNTPSEMIDKLESIGITNVTDNKLQQLASNASNIITNEEEDWAAYNRFKRAEILENLLGIDVGYTNDCAVKIDKITGITKKGQNIINDIKEVASQYSQYMQFKRAYFDCTEVIYDTDTKRVVEMNFELQVKDGKVVFN